MGSTVFEFEKETQILDPNTLLNELRKKNKERIKYEIWECVLSNENWDVKREIWVIWEPNRA